MRTQPPIKKNQVIPEKKTDNIAQAEPISPATNPVPKPLIPANEQIAQDIVNDRPKSRPGRPSKQSAQVIIEDSAKPVPVKYPDPTPETNAMAQVIVETLCNVMAMALGDHCKFNAERDSLMVSSWSKYFAFKGFSDFPPSYMAFGATAMYIGRVALDPATRKHLEDRKKDKEEKAAQREAAKNN